MFFKKGKASLLGELCGGASFIFQKVVIFAHTAKRPNVWFNTLNPTALQFVLFNALIFLESELFVDFKT